MNNTRYFLVMLAVILFNIALCSGNLMHSANGDDHNITLALKAEVTGTPRNRIVPGGCRKSDVSVTEIQVPTSGVPRFTVQIVSLCSHAYCRPSNLHVHCGWLSAWRTFLNPAIIKRLAFDDCLINDGKPLEYGKVIRFTYQNDMKNNIRFKSVQLC